jgi:hypothetical protein
MHKSVSLLLKNCLCEAALRRGNLPLCDYAFIDYKRKTQ